MPSFEAPIDILGSAPPTLSVEASPTPSEISSTSTPEPQHIQPTPMFRALAMRPPEPMQPPGQDELERRLPGYQRIVIPRELTLIDLLKQSSGVITDEEVLRIREAKLRVIADSIGLRRLHVLVPNLRSLTLDGSVLGSLRELGIGLVHLKILNVNRCGLTSLDGVWGLLKLRELRAADNRIQELHPLAAMQKLHTLDLAKNPISSAERLWTLGVSSSLRKLTLKGTPAADEPDYVEKVFNALPSLTHLDDKPLDGSDEIQDIPEDCGSDADGESPQPAAAPRPVTQPEPGPSTSNFKGPLEPEDDDCCSLGSPEIFMQPTKKLHARYRPATTENAGVRPERPVLPRRPKTALEAPNIDAPTRLQILNMLTNEEWRCSGSKLTSRSAVSGNLARALRRPHSARFTPESVKQLSNEAINEAARVIAAEIPEAPILQDFARFKEETGIEIKIDFDEWSKRGDPESAITRLEQIERETSDRLKGGNSCSDSYGMHDLASFCYDIIRTD